MIRYDRSVKRSGVRPVPSKKSSWLNRRGSKMRSGKKNSRRRKPEMLRPSESVLKKQRRNARYVPQD